MDAPQAAQNAPVLMPSSSDLRQSTAYCHWIKSLGWQVANLGKSRAFIKKIPLLGSVVKLQRPAEPIPYSEISKIARRHRAIIVKLEPKVSADEPSLLVHLKSHHYQASKWALLSTKTLILDLQSPLPAIFDQFKKDCRYEIKKALNSHFGIEKNNFENFYQLLQKSNKIKGLWTVPKPHYDNLVKSFGKNVFCLDVSIHRYKKPIAGCLVLIAGKTAYYFLAGSLPEGKQAHAPYLVVWEAIKEAKKRVCTRWDFEGIYDDRIPSTRSWKGFTHFKKSFGGYEVTFPGSFTWYRHPVLRLLSPFMT